MKHLKYVLFGLLILLSFSTGLTKVVQMPEEMALFANAGFEDRYTIFFGLLQIIGGMLLLPSKTRRIGAGMMAATFIVATIVVFINQMIAFGLFSLLFIVLGAYFFKYPTFNPRRNEVVEEPGS